MIKKPTEVTRLEELFRSQFESRIGVGLLDFESGYGKSRYGFSVAFVIPKTLQTPGKDVMFEGHNITENEMPDIITDILKNLPNNGRFHMAHKLSSRGNHEQTQGSNERTGHNEATFAGCSSIHPRRARYCQRNTG
jgi:hypothetical protein